VIYLIEIAFGSIIIARFFRSSRGQAGMAETDFKYDVFISYSSANKDWVRKDLLIALEEVGLKVCIDFRDFKAGKPEIKNMRDSILESKHTLLVLTEAYLKSGWTDFENLLSQTIDPANRKGRIVPLLKEKCELPLEIGYLTYVNFLDPDDWNIAWKQLFSALAVPDTTKPDITKHDTRTPERYFAHLIPNPTRNTQGNPTMNNLNESEENELKLIVSEETQAKMLASIRGKGTSEVGEILRIVEAALHLAEFDISQEKVEIIMDEYFDTRELAVYGSRASFRVRRSNGKAEITLKTPKEMQLGLFSRREQSEVISEDAYSDFVRTGFLDIVTALLPEFKDKNFSLILRVNNERRSFSLKRRGELYALAVDLFIFINPRTGETSEEQSEVEIEALNQSAKRKLGSIRRNLVEIVKAFDYSRDSKYERGIKYLGIDKHHRLQWFFKNWNTPKGLAWIGIIATVITALVGIILTLLLRR
jgi:hypothetical protein